MKYTLLFLLLAGCENPTAPRSPLLPVVATAQPDTFCIGVTGPFTHATAVCYPR